MAHILIVDDDIAIRDLLETLLSDEGHRVLATGDGYVALSLVVQRRPDLIIADYVMPPPNGIRLLQMLRSQRIHIPSILITGKTPPTHHPADALLVKPIDAATLGETIRRLLHEHFLH